MTSHADESRSSQEEKLQKGNIIAATKAETRPTPPRKKMKQDDEKEVDKLESAVLQLVKSEQKDKHDADRQYCLSLVPILHRMIAWQKSMLCMTIE